MEISGFIPALAGGLLIGIAVTAMLLFNGRVTGISGIISASLVNPLQEGAWRLAFVGGLLAGGILLKIAKPEFLANATSRGWLEVGAAGLLVGFGTVMGSGCTSGHGVCGISRFSMRSMLATLVFMLFGFLSVSLLHFIGVN